MIVMNVSPTKLQRLNESAKTFGQISRCCTAAFYYIDFRLCFSHCFAYSHPVAVIPQTVSLLRITSSHTHKQTHTQTPITVKTETKTLHY